MNRIVAIVIVAALAMLGWLYWQQSRSVPFVVSGFIEADEIRVGSRVGGRVAKVIAQEADRVKPGDPLFIVDPFDLLAKLAEAKASLAAFTAEHSRLTTGYRKEEIEQARAKALAASSNLDKLVAGPRALEIKIARDQLNAEKADHDLAQSEYDRLARLQKQEQAAQKEFDEAISRLKSTAARVAAAEHQLALLEEGTRKEEIAQAKATLADLQANLALLEKGYRPEDIAQAAANKDAAQARVEQMDAQLRELTIAAPCKCLVETVEIRPGDMVAPNAPAIALLDLQRMWVRAYVPESRLGQVKLNQRVPISVDSFPGRKFAAHVTFISSDAEFTPRNIQTPEERSKQVFRIKVTLDEGQDVLRIGMAADVLLDQASSAAKGSPGKATP